MNLGGRAGAALTAVLAFAAASRAATQPGWTRLEAPQMVVYSELSARATSSWAVQFQQFHLGLGHLLRLNEAALRPVTVVLFRNDAEFRPYKPVENGKPAALSGYFVRSELGNFIAAAGDPKVDLRHIIFHEATHWLTNVSDVPVPLWLDEGLAEVFSTFTVSDHTCTFGDILPWHVALLRRGGLMPLKDLMRVRHGELLFNERQRTGIFYAESWAFMHYLLFSADAGGFQTYNQLIHELRPGADPDQVFRRIFGTDCVGMQLRLLQYLARGRYRRYTRPFDRGAVEARFQTSPAPGAEVDLAESCLLEGANQPAAALPRLVRVVRQAPQRPIGWEALGFAYFQLQSFSEAEPCFRQAAARGSRSYFVYSFLGDAELGLHPGEQVRLTGSGAPTPAQLRRAVDDYEHELELNPREPHAYDNIAMTLYLLEPPTPGDLAAVAQGARLYPANAVLAAGAAVAALKTGRRSEGLSRLRTVAADASPQDSGAAHYARSILQVETMRDALAEVNRRWRAHDFTGVQAAIDEMLPNAASDPQRRELLTMRARAGILAICSRAVDLANAGDPAGARHLLEEAAADPAADTAIRNQIRSLLAKLGS